MMVTLGDVAEWGSGGTPNRSMTAYFGEGVPWVSISDLNDGYVSATKESLTSSGLKNSSAKVVPPGTLFVAMYGSIGKLGISTTGMCTSQAIAFAKPDPSRVDLRFLFHFLLTSRRRLQALGRGGTQMNIGQKDLKSLKIDLPALSEQRRIAAILDQADAVRAKRREDLARLDALPQAAYRQMFAETGASATVADIAQSEKGSIRTGPFGSQLLHEEFVDSGVAVLGLDNVVGNMFKWGERRYITDEKYRQLARYTVHPGDVLISIMGTVGRCIVVPRNLPLAINTKHICAITTDKDRMDPEFLRATFLWHPSARHHLRTHTKGAIMAGLNMGIIKALPVPVPSLVRQRRFSEMTVAVDRQREQVRSGLALDDELFASLQHRAFRGEL